MAKQMMRAGTAAPSGAVPIRVRLRRIREFVT